MRDFRCKTYIEIEMVIKAKDWLEAHETCEGHTGVRVEIDVWGAEVVSIAYDDCPAWEIEDDTPCDADPDEPEVDESSDYLPGIDDLPW